MGMFTDALNRAGLMRNLASTDVAYDLTGSSKSLSSLLAKDVEMFGYEMDAVLMNLHPSVAELIVRKVVPVMDTMRMANTETKAGFGGSTGSGSSLEFEISRAADFLNPDVTSGSRKTWERFVTAVDTNKPLITGTVATVGTAVDLQMAEEEAMVFLGFTNKAGVESKASAVQVVYNTDTMNYQVMNFDMSSVKEQDILLYELKQDVKVPPEQKIQINVRYDAIGADYLTPVVIHFVRSSDMRTM